MAHVPPWSAPGGTSPWTVLLPPYGDGSQAAIGTTLRGVVKHVFLGDRFERVSFLRLPRRRFGFDWNLLVTRTGDIVVTSTRENSFYLVGDTAPDCPDCDLEIRRTLAVPEAVGQITVNFTLSYDGTLIALLEDNRLAALSPATGDVLDVFDLGLADTDISFHNAFPIDETGRTGAPTTISAAPAARASSVAASAR